MSTPVPLAGQPSSDHNSHNLISTQGEEIVNTHVVRKRRPRQLKASIVLGDYDMKVKFIPSVENPGNYEVELIEVDKISNEEEVDIPPQYRERAHNWKLQIRKRLSNGRVEKFYYQEGVGKTYKSQRQATTYILQGHTPRKSPIKRKGEASSSSKNGKKAKEEEIAEKEYDSIKEYDDDCYTQQLQNFSGDMQEGGHASSSVPNNNIGEQESDAVEVEHFLSQSYNKLLRNFY